MRSDHGPTGSTRQTEDVRTKLIDAAERLVALHTEEGTSSRAIIAAAGQRHNSAITYHFGDRRGLLDAVWERRAAVVEEARRPLMDGWAGREPAPRELAEAWILPFADFVGRGEPSYWARFNEDELRRYPLNMLPLLRPNLAGRPQEPLLDRLVELLEQLVRHAGDGPEAPIRVSTAVRMTVSAFAAWERDAEAGRPVISAADLGSIMVEATLDLLRAESEVSAAGR